MKMLSLQCLEYTEDRSEHSALTIDIYANTHIGASFLSAYLPACQLAWIDEPHIMLTPSDVSGGYWELTQLSTRYRCAINGRNIAPHESVLLTVADTIEIGFLVFKVAPPSLPAQQPTAQLVDTEDPTDIVLTETPDSHDIQTLLNIPLNSTDTPDNPFSMLSEFTLADALTTGKPKSTDDMMHELDIKNVPTVVAATRSQNTANPHQNTQQHLTQLPVKADTSYAEKKEGTAEQIKEAKKEEKKDVLLHLAADYNKVIDDPEYLYHMSLYNKAVVKQTALKTPVDDLFDTQHKTINFLTIEDQLMGNLQIDDILNMLGEGTVGDFMEDNTTRADVLHLFVDPHRRKTKLTKKIPATTLKDHHAMSLDSHLTPVGGHGKTNTAPLTENAINDSNPTLTPFAPNEQST